MARALEPAVTPDDIVFELERFERSDGRLNLSGRWFGVRGRRFVRPTLTLDVSGERVRALADLDDKPWPAADGEPWRASFPLDNGGQVEESELSVAPDITIQLPAPSSRRTRAQRLSAVPRREAMTASWGDWPAAVEATPAAATEEERAVAGEVAVAEREPDEALTAVAEPPEDSRPEPTREDVEALLAQLAEVSNAAATSSAELEVRQADLGAVQVELAAAQAELTEARAAREAALRNAARAEAERETALTRVAEAEAERETALTRAAQAEAERDAIAAERAGAAAALERAQVELGRLARERDQAMNSRGAALVMRGATHALPASERHVGWLRRGLALLVLIGAVFAALIVLHVL